MSDVRKILSARAARPHVEELVGALVDAAVFIGRADGRFSEQELEVFIDSLREVVSAAVGDEAVGALAATPRLLDLARSGRARLAAQGHAAFLAGLSPRFPGAFARDGLVLAFRIAVADGRVTADEAAAFRELAQAVGLDVAEAQVLEDLAQPPAPGPAPVDAGALVTALHARGWTPVPDSKMDASARLVRPGLGAIDLELDVAAGALHLQLHDAGAQGAHVVCRFGAGLSGLLAVIDALRDSLAPSTLGQKLPALKAVCPDLFVEDEGRFTRA